MRAPRRPRVDAYDVGFLVLFGAMFAVAVADAAFAQAADPNVNPSPLPPTPAPPAPSPLGDLSAGPPAPAPAPAAAAEPIPLQHGDIIAYTIAPDNRSATMHWQSTPHERLPGPNGTWADYRLEVMPHGDARYTSTALNATVLAAECAVRLDTGGEIHHALLWQTGGDFPGPWQRHERATAGECALAIHDTRPQVNATWEGGGIAWTRTYDFTSAAAAPAVEWTYHLAVTGAEGADRAYAFRTIMAGHPAMRNGTVQAIGSAYDRAGTLDESGPWAWGPYSIDWKDDEHRATGATTIIAPRTGDAVLLHRAHPAGNAGQIQTDFTHNAFVQQVGDIKTVDPVATVARTGAFDIRTQQSTVRTCADWIGRNPTGGEVHDILPHASTNVGSFSYNYCHVQLYTHSLPATVGARIHNATYTFDVEHTASAPAYNVVYFGNNFAPPRLAPNAAMRADARSIWLALDAAALPTTAAAVNIAAPPILGFPTIPSSTAVGARATATLSMENATILQALYGTPLQSGQTVAHVISWQSQAGVNIVRDARNIRVYTATPSLSLGYDVPLQPIESVAVASITTRPGSLSPVDGSPPYARLVLRVNQTGGLADALTPTAYTVQVKDPAVDNRWRLVGAYGAEPAVYTGATTTFYASHTTDAWPDTTFALHGRGPFEWRVAPLYSTEFANPNSNNVQGPWFAVPGDHALCGVAPSPPGNLTVQVGATGITATWSEPHSAPSAECGPLTYSYRVSDGASARTHSGSGLTARTFTATGFPAGDSLTVAVQATNEYGTSAAATWTGRTLTSAHVQAANFAVAPVAMNELSPTVKRERSGSALFTWTIDPARPATLPVGVLAPSEYEIYYLRQDADAPGDTYWQPLALGAAGAAYPPARPYEVYYHWRDNQAGYWNTPGGFQPGVSYRLKLEPHYTDSTVGQALYADYTGPASRITGALIEPTTNAAGYTLNNNMTARANLTLIADAAGNPVDAGGVEWAATWQQQSQPQATVIARTATASDTAATFTCTIPQSGKDANVDPCLYLVGGDAVQDETYTAYLRHAGGARYSTGDHAIFPVAAPCRISAPHPTNMEAAFVYGPADGAPAEGRGIGNLSITWRPPAETSPGMYDCTYHVDGYQVGASRDIGNDAIVNNFQPWLPYRDIPDSDGATASYLLGGIWASTAYTVGNQGRHRRDGRRVLAQYRRNRRAAVAGAEFPRRRLP